MGRQTTGADVAMIVTGVLMLILSLSLFGVTGAILETSNDYEGMTEVPGVIQLFVGGWYLLTSVFAIASGASGHKCPYVTVLVLTILAIFVALGGAVLAIIAIFTKAFYDESTIVSVKSPDVRIMGSTVFPPGEFGLASDKDGLEIVTGSSIQRSVNKALDLLGGLPYGVMIINCISFVLLIIISGISCCGTCCNGSSRRMPAQATTIVTTSGGYTTTTTPPGYVTQPPAGQRYVFQGMSNPNYDTSVAMNSYTASPKVAE